MKMMAVGDLKVGMEIASDVMSDIGITFLAKGTVISGNHIDSFMRMGVDFVYINDTSHAVAVKPNDRDAYIDALNDYKKIYMTARIGTSIANMDYMGLMAHLFTQYASSNDVLGKIRSVEVEDLYIYKHAINVSIIAMCIARWLKFSKNEILELGLSGYLHDIGKCSIAGNILNKPDKLSFDEYEIVKAHSKYSHDIAKHISEMTPKLCEGILYHHERLDGTGYPSQLRGSEIPLYGRILAVADVFDAILSDRIYSSKVTPYKAIEMLKDESFGKLDPKVVNVLVKNIADFYVGNVVKLSSGQVGEVILLNKSNLTRPLIKVDEGHYVDLSTNYKIEILEVLNMPNQVETSYL